jgi:hypothetical protein
MDLTASNQASSVERISGNPQNGIPEKISTPTNRHQDSDIDMKKPPRVFSDFDRPLTSSTPQQQQQQRPAASWGYQFPTGANPGMQPSEMVRSNDQLAVFVENPPTELPCPIRHCFQPEAARTRSAKNGSIIALPRRIMHKI